MQKKRKSETFSTPQERFTLKKNTLIHTIYDSILAHDSPLSVDLEPPSPKSFSFKTISQAKTPSTSYTHDQLSLKLCKERESRICTNLSDCLPVPTALLVCYRSCSRPRTPLPAGNHDQAASSRA